MWMHGDVGWGWMAVGWAWMLVFWGAIIWFGFWAVTRLTGERTAPGSTPMDIARARYARGEITKEEFDSLKRDLA